jgi:hypothetical protein
MHFWLVAIPAPHAIRIQGYIFVWIKFEPPEIQVALLVLTISGIPMPQVKDAAFDAAERAASVREEWICPGAVMLALVRIHVSRLFSVFKFTNRGASNRLVAAPDNAGVVESVLLEQTS